MKGVTIDATKQGKEARHRQVRRLGSGKGQGDRNLLVLKSRETPYGVEL